MRKKLKEKIFESLSSVLPVTLIVLFLSFTTTFMPIGTLMLFVLGAILLIVGMGFFSLGVDIAMMPMGDGIGSQLAKSKKIPVMLIIAFLIGVAVTAADPRPFHSMAAHKEPGAKEALVLLRNAGRVSSVCNDVVGDICGIVSGTTTAVIVVRLQTAFALPESVLLSVAVTALVSGLTIGGKALGKKVAINSNVKIVLAVGKVINWFGGIFRRKRGKS